MGVWRPSGAYLKYTNYSTVSLLGVLCSNVLMFWCRYTSESSEWIPILFQHYCWESLIYTRGYLKMLTILIGWFNKFKKVFTSLWKSPIDIFELPDFWKGSGLFVKNKSVVVLVIVAKQLSNFVTFVKLKRIPSFQLVMHRNSQNYVSFKITH